MKNTVPGHTVISSHRRKRQGPLEKPQRQPLQSRRRPLDALPLWRLGRLGAGPVVGAVQQPLQLLRYAVDDGHFVAVGQHLWRLQHMKNVFVAFVLYNNHITAGSVKSKPRISRSA